MVHILEALEDNYIYLVKLQDGSWLAVDPSEAEPVQQFLNHHGARLTHILNTHHHPDHVGGNHQLKASTQAMVTCSTYDLTRIASADRGVSDGETLDLGGSRAQVLAIPGHTLGHIAFYFAELNAVFVGDTLFRSGCGRLFEGTPLQMLTSLQKLMALPDTTLIYCGHEYTIANLRFAQALEPHSVALQNEIECVQTLRKKGLPSLPTELGREKELNPFLRAHDPTLRRALQLEQASDLEVFTYIRQRKDTFRNP
jgi:hydroxyacylglutathione hydrolase